MSSDAAPPAQTAPDLGSLIGGRYRIEAKLGQGGMGAVYLVRDERDGSKLALKQLRPTGETSAAFQFSQFEREYHTLAQLAHPRIIEVYEYGVENGVAYYTMELLDGQDLRERGITPWREVCSVLCDVASSLAILHSRKLVHRDVSARNVRCTRDGRAKLIDFGTMTPMGVARHVAGTPPFVPPEALQLQALDGRSDLYALGSLAYHMLTGRYAYPARNFEQLRDLWRSPPNSPRAYDEALPEALDRLVMEMIQLDRAARPSSAAEVMERLSGIAGLALDELPEVSRAYLAMPTLIGRDAPLLAARRALVKAMQGAGTSLLVEGDEGSGRSRFLDAVVLESRLLGSLVLRGDAGDAAGGEYGLVKALARQLLHESPDVALRSARPWRSLLAYLLPELERSSVPARGIPERRHVQSAVRNWFLLTSRRRHIVIAVDDVHAVDASSAAVLGLLAHGAKRHRVSLVLTTLRGAPETPALALLREIAQPLLLTPLSPVQTEALVRSVFGDVAHVASLAERIHHLAQGHPRWTMALCERLVERRAARYEAGSWSLPSELSTDDLPESLLAVLSARIAALSPDARDLAETLSLTEPSAFSSPDYPALASHGDHARAHRAEGELVALGVLVPDGEQRNRFAQREIGDLLRAGIAEENQQAMHARIAVALGDLDEPALVAHHLLLGGREREAIDYLLTLRDHPALVYSNQVLELLELALARCQALSVPTALQLELQTWIVSHAALLGDPERFNRYAWPLLERFTRDSGLSDELALEAEILDPGERLARAIALAAQRHAALPETLRGLPPDLAGKQLMRLCGIIVGMAAVVIEMWPLERLPPIARLIPVLPGARTLQLHIECVSAMLAARYDVARPLMNQIVKQLEQPETDLHPAYVKQARLGCLYMGGLLMAGVGHPGTRKQLAELEKEPGHRVLAWRAFMVYELMLGNVAAAADCQRRAELLNLQDGGQLIFPGTTAAMELVVHCAADDLIGVKRSMERLTELGATYTGWRPFVAVARAHYRRLQGDYDGALEVLEPALPLAPPGRTHAFQIAAACHLQLVTMLRPADEAVACGQRYLEQCVQERLASAHHGLQRLLAEALAKAGRVDEAEQMANEHLEKHLAMGTRGLLLGLACETRARVAIARQNEEELRHYATMCANEYKGGRNPILSGKYQQLIREAEVGGFTLTSGLAHAADADSKAVSQTVSGRTANSRLLACIGTDERAHEGVRMLLELTGARDGYVFGVHAGRLTQAHSVEVPAPQEITALLEAYLKRTLVEGGDEVITASEGDASQATPLERWTDPTGRQYEPFALYRERNGIPTITAVAALQYETQERPVLQRDVLEMLADVLGTEDRSLHSPS